MYKLISNNLIVDVVDNPIFARYSDDLHKMVPSNIATADAILGSDKKTYYALQGKPTPAGKSHWKPVSLVKITETEYKSLRDALSSYGILVNNMKVTEKVRLAKIADMKDKCSEAIISGVTVECNGGVPCHFSLTIEDQLNLADISRRISEGAPFLMYHSDGDACRLFSNEEMSKILEAVSTHRNFHTTYFNLLKYCINNMTDIEKISAIRYGDSLLSLDIPQSVKTFVKERLDGQ